MRIKLRNRQREPLFAVAVDARKPPPVVRGPGGRELYLHWDQALDDQGYLRRCPVCECRELFARRDFPQAVGLVIVVLAAAVALTLFALGHVLMSFALLGAVVAIDALIFLVAGRCLVCYRCRSEFRDLPIRKDHAGWDQAVGEKYRAPAAPPEPVPAVDQDRAP